MDATGHAGVGLLAAAGGVQLADVVAAHLEGLARRYIGQLAGREVAHRQPADVVLVVGHAHRADLVVEVHDDRVLAQHLRVLLDAGGDLLAVVKVGHLVQVDDDGLDLLAAHDRADATTRGQPRGAQVLVAKGDAGQQPLVFADRAAEGNGHLATIVLVEHLGGCEIAFAQVGRRVVEGDRAVLA